jgi:hypothetical protein
VPLAPPQTIRSGGVAQLFSASELIEVGTGLSLVFFALMLMRHDWTPDEEREPAKKRTTKKGDREPKTARQR